MAKPSTTLLVLAILGLSMVTPEAWARDLLPAKVRVKILMTSLAYDKNLKNGRAGGIRIGVLHLTEHARGKKEAQEVHQAIADSPKGKINGLPLSSQTIAVTDLPKALEQFKSDRINIVYISQGLEKHLPELLKICAMEKIVTMAGTEELVEQGVALGAIMQARKPRILVNLEGSRTQGCQLDSRLLRLATVVDQ